MPKKLEQYRSMRRFEKTPEPAGDEAGGDGDRARFVVQQHSATRLHWDLRLERDGVLASWACPRGIPQNPKRNHLAVHTEDHPLEYLEFHGEIPEGEYGAGDMFIWDHGTYETHKWEDDEVMVTLHGERVGGRYVLFQTRGRDWMIHRMDPPADPTREPVATDLRPMLATKGKLPATQKGFAFEVRWDGRRALLTSEDGVVTIVDAHGNDVSAQFPEIRRIGRTIGSTEVILDGVIVALKDGRPDPQRLDRRLEAESDSRIRRLVRDAPAVFMAFDLVWLEGHSIAALPYSERRELLEELELSAEAWQTPAYHEGQGSDFLEAVRAQGLPGIVAKKLDSPYEPGKKSKAWIEVDT